MFQRQRWLLLSMLCDLSGRNGKMEATGVIQARIRLRKGVRRVEARNLSAAPRPKCVLTYINHLRCLSAELQLNARLLCLYPGRRISPSQIRRLRPFNPCCRCTQGHRVARGRTRPRLNSLSASFIFPVCSPFYEPMLFEVLSQDSDYSAYAQTVFLEIDFLERYTVLENNFGLIFQSNSCVSCDKLQ